MPWRFCGYQSGLTIWSELYGHSDGGAFAAAPFAVPQGGIAPGAPEQLGEVRRHAPLHARRDVVLDLVAALRDRVAPVVARRHRGENSSLSRCSMIRRTWLRTMFRSLSALHLLGEILEVQGRADARHRRDAQLRRGPWSRRNGQSGERRSSTCAISVLAKAPPKLAHPDEQAQRPRCQACAGAMPAVGDRSPFLPKLERCVDMLARRLRRIGARRVKPLDVNRTVASKIAHGSTK